MAEDFGLKIGLEGEKEFKKALSDINQSFKVLGSEMKLVASQFDKNDKSVESLTEKNKVLDKEIDAQKGKIDTLRSALQNAAQSFGENDRRTQNWQIQLNNAEAALNEMERELKNNNEALDDVSDTADESSGKFEKLSGVLKGIGVAMGSVAVAAGAAAVALGKEVITAYADYEQLVGGVDTLFKDSSQELQKYAAGAYKTAGMSANDYMETVTSFSASLIQSLDGDTAAAVKSADKAITDMSDNANKMGTDISLIQNAYQGFAKQNYTMLDNLKLGYGGTKTEMERLLKDAEAISGIKYDISSYADVVDAIHVIQESMGVAGATAQEAEGTISGSLNSLQAAFSNMIVGFGDANADMTMLCENVVNALNSVIANITPVIENIVASLPTVVDALLSAIASLLPMLLETVAQLFSQLLNTILTLLPQLVPVVIEALLTIVQAIIDNIPLLLDAAVQIVITLVTAIGEALPRLIPAAVQAVITIVQGLADSLPLILDAALKLIMGLAEGILTALPVLINALPEIITSIIQFLVDAIPQIIETGIQLLTSIVSALPEIITAIVTVLPQIIESIITTLLDAIPQIIQAGIDLLIALVQALPEIITTIVKAIPEIISGILDALIGNIDKIIMAGVQLFVALIENLPTIIVEIVKAVPPIITGLVEAIISFVPKLAEAGLNLIKGLWNGISDAGAWLWEKISGFFDGVVDKIKDFFGIHSPSTLFAGLGGYMAEGLGEGFGDEMGEVSDGMTDATAEAGDLTGKAAIEAVKNGILSNLDMLKEPINEIVHLIGNSLMEILPEVLALGLSADDALAEGILEGSEDSVLYRIREFIDKIIALFESVGGEFVYIGRMIMEGIGEGITSRSAWLNRLLRNYINDMKRRVESMLGIHSPSKVYAEIGSFMAEGIGVGFERSMNKVRTQMEDAIPTAGDNGFVGFSTADLVNGLIGGLSPMLAGAKNGAVTVKVELDSKTIAKTIFDPLKDVSKQRGVSLG